MLAEKIETLKQIILICSFLLLAGCSLLPDTTNPISQNNQVKEEPLDPPQVRRGQIRSGGTVEPTAEIIRADLDNLGPAHELTNQVWLNADQPLRLAKLRGSVVLLDMWTFG